MRILGLTGSIGMGKSTTARALARLGVPVHDADAAVHRLQGPGGAAVPLIEAAFPGTVRDGRVDRQALGARVLGDPAALKRLERIVHPLVGRATERFLTLAARQRRRMVALDVPLLLEGSGHRQVDAVLVVSAPAAIQRQRVLARPGMTPLKLDQILAKQMPDARKRQLADAVLPTGLGLGHSLRALKRILRRLKRRPARHWPRRRFLPRRPRRRGGPRRA